MARCGPQQTTPKRAYSTPREGRLNITGGPTQHHGRWGVAPARVGARAAFQVGTSGYSAPVPQLRLALAQVNPTVGDLAGNADLVVEWARKAADAGAHVVAFPELVLNGYPVEDL
ncbi:MAG: nitrilase-related carbon-nitrogen hydrolase, partial [Nocardioidaceae bacterium]